MWYNTLRYLVCDPKKVDIIMRSIKIGPFSNHYIDSACETVIKPCKLYSGVCVGFYHRNNGALW